MKFTRICYKMHFKKQRERIFAWLGGIGFVVCLLYYNNDLLVQQTHPMDVPVVEQGRKPMAVHADMPIPFKDEDPIDLDLLPDLAPAILHYIWCGRKVFEYKHYLALKSAHRAVKPDKVFFHYEELPLEDEQGYYQWYNETLTDIDHILIRPLNQSGCPQRGTPERYILVLDLLEKFGGIYVPEDSIWVDFPVHLRANSIVSGVSPINPLMYQEGIIVAKKRGFTKPISNEEMLITLSVGKHGELKPCASEHEYNTDRTGHIICVRITKQLFPKDIWNSQTKLGTLARVVSYGSTEVRHNYNKETPIPKIGHYACIECTLKFSTYLSMLSAIFVAGLNKVYIHGVQHPSGSWWKLLVQDPRFVFVYREYPETLYDRAVMSPELAMGIMRADILLKYGGVYQDQNVLWTQRIPESYFGYESVASPHWHLYGHWPDSVNHGVVMSKRNSRYMTKVREILKKNKNNQFWFNDQYLSYKIVEKHPELIKLDRHLQVMCLNHNCHPTWQDNYRSGLMQNRPGGWFSWQNDTLSIHWVDTYPELDLDMIKYTSGMIVDVSRNILHSADVDIKKL